MLKMMSMIPPVVYAGSLGLKEASEEAPRMTLGQISVADYVKRTGKPLDFYGCHFQVIDPRPWNVGRIK
jgi:hypothetical protein